MFFEITSLTFFPWNKILPEAISYNMHPILKISDFYEYCLLEYTSGAKYPGVPKIYTYSSNSSMSIANP